jgi:hypothetical protein
MPTTGSRVFPARLYPLAKEELPGLCIYTNSEETDDEQGKFDTFDTRRLTLSVEGWTKLIAGIDDDLDDISEEVEDKLLSPGETLGGIAKTIDLTTTDTGKSSESDQPVGLVKMDFRITYFINRGSSGTPL